MSLSDLTPIQLVFDGSWPRVLFSPAMILLLVIINGLIGIMQYFPPEAMAGTPEPERGVGSRVLKGLAEKYDGSLKQEQKDGIFMAELILNLNQR